MRGWSVGGTSVRRRAPNVTVEMLALCSCLAGKCVRERAAFRCVWGREVL